MRSRIKRLVWSLGLTLSLGLAFIPLLSSPALAALAPVSLAPVVLTGVGIIVLVAVIVYVSSDSSVSTTTDAHRVPQMDDACRASPCLLEGPPTSTIAPKRAMTHTTGWRIIHTISKCTRARPQQAAAASGKETSLFRRLNSRRCRERCPFLRLAEEA